MAKAKRSNTRLASTTWMQESGSLRRGGAPERNSTDEVRSVWDLRTRDPREPLGLTARLTRGPEDKWEIYARGMRWVVPGHVGLGDVMRWINRSSGYLDR